ncbi:hypothetical protein LBMAG42_57080 [Deltaproteobacteria bacterium]|nr:hypothetical protein LBMAG42_57080 [Deltaproteobacteria bacterium]
MNVCVQYSDSTGADVLEVETGRTFRMPRTLADDDARVATDDAAWRSLVGALARGAFVVHPVPGLPLQVRRCHRETVHPSGQAPGVHLAWRSRGHANWHVIKHALHLRSIPFERKGMQHQWPAEDWPADPAQARARVEELQKLTGCGVKEWGPGVAQLSGRAPDCIECPAWRSFRCAGELAGDEAPYDDALRRVMGEGGTTVAVENAVEVRDARGNAAVVRRELGAWRTLSLRRMISRSLARSQNPAALTALLAKLETL